MEGRKQDSKNYPLSTWCNYLGWKNSCLMWHETPLRHNMTKENFTLHSFEEWNWCIKAQSNPREYWRDAKIYQAKLYILVMWIILCLLWLTFMVYFMEQHRKNKWSSLHPPALTGWILKTNRGYSVSWTKEYREAKYTTMGRLECKTWAQSWKWK